MSEEIQNQNVTPIAQNPVAPQAPASQPVPAANAALNAQTPVEQQGVAPAPQPYKIDRLGENKEFEYVDKNGYTWHYTLQFPGMKRMYEILDEASLPNGGTAQSVLYADYLKDVVVKPGGLTLDAFNTRPGFQELMTAADEFCGSRISL